jgi:hypothetical protein
LRGRNGRLMKQRAMIRHCRRLRLGCPIALVLGLASSARACSGLEPICVSVHSFVPGGADVAVGDSALSRVNNPATLTLSPRGRLWFDTAGVLVVPHSTWRGPLDTADSTWNWNALANMGLAMPVDDRLTLGMASHSKARLRYVQDNWWIGDSCIAAFSNTLHGGGWGDIPLRVDYGLGETEQPEHAFVAGFGQAW